jgi:hypothetical protein
MEFRCNKIGLKALLLGGRIYPGQRRVHDRKTSLLVFLSMPPLEAFKPLYMFFRLWAPAPRRSLVRRRVCVCPESVASGWLIIDLAPFSLLVTQYEYSYSFPPLESGRGGCEAISLRRPSRFSSSFPYPAQFPFRKCSLALL